MLISWTIFQYNHCSSCFPLIQLLKLVQRTRLGVMLLGEILWRDKSQHFFVKDGDWLMCCGVWWAESHQLLAVQEGASGIKGCTVVRNCMEMQQRVPCTIRWLWKEDGVMSRPWSAVLVEVLSHHNFKDLWLSNLPREAKKLGCDIVVSANEILQITTT